MLSELAVVAGLTVRLDGVGERVGEAVRADVWAVVVDQVVPAVTRMAGVLPEASAALAGPPAGRGELTTDGREIVGA